MEWSYGRYEGRTTAEIRQGHPGWTVWADGAPGGETVEEVSARADRVIMRAHEAEDDVVLLAHGHLLRALAARWLGLPAQAGRLFALAPATLSVLGHEREQPVVIRWNDRCHLVLPSDVWAARKDEDLAGRPAG